MFLKRFRSSNVRDALRAVREDLGPDALVLSTAMVQARGWRGLLGAREVEVTAAADRDLSDARPPVSEDRQGPSRVAADIAAQLVATGMDRAMAEDVAASIPAGSRRGATPARLRDALASRLANLAAPIDRFARAEVFVGPPGAGKTTTIAKIAAQERARGGRLGLIAADGFRIGAVEQLQTYADILDAPFRVARTPDDLESALAHRHRLPVLVDTAGRSPSDPATRELFRVVGQAQAAGVRTHLVLPAGTTATAARKIRDRYAEAKPSRLVLTKLDEAESLSPLASLLHEWQLPISYVGTGQRVPEDLNRATAEFLAASVLGESAPQPALLS